MAVALLCGIDDVEMGHQGGLVNAIGNVVPYAPLGGFGIPMLAIRACALVLGAS